MIVRPYGDTRDDGIVQLSFTLPIAHTAKAPDVGKRLLESIGFRSVEIAECKPIDSTFTFYVAYGRTDAGIDPEEVHGDYLEVEAMDFAGVNSFIRESMGRKIIVVGAAIESDAHTVGIDAILNMKGFAGHYGLERYQQIVAVNLGAQVPAEVLVTRALELRADALLVSQIVTQKDVHVQNLTKLIELLEAERIRERFLLVVGGPRISNAFAKELGYDAGFGPRTSPLDVAAYLAQEIVRRSRDGEGVDDG
jgi:beta-lysine 5,6-aminomutase beta subunit